MVSVTMPCDTETILTLLEVWLTTHASSSVSGFTETGPSPTGIWASKLGEPGVVTLNTDNDAFAVFTANRRVPSAESRIGLVWDSSKFANAGGGACAVVVTRANRVTKAARKAIRIKIGLVITILPSSSEICNMAQDGPRPRSAPSGPCNQTILPKQPYSQGIFATSVLGDSLLESMVYRWGSQAWLASHEKRPPCLLYFNV